MEGLYFGKHLMGIFVGLFLIWAITLCILPFFEKESFTLEEESRYKVEHKIGIKEIIEIILLIATILGVVFFILICQIRFMMWFLVVFGIIYLGIAILGSFYEFIKYIIGKSSSDYQITTKKQQSFILVGICVITAFDYLSKENYYDMINIFMSENNTFVFDIIKMLILIVWYFSAIFFSLATLILILHNIVVIFRCKCKEKKYKELKSVYKEFNCKFVSKMAWRKFEVIQRNRPLKKILYYCIWMLSIVIDAIQAFFIAMLNLVYRIVLIIIFYPRIIIKSVLYNINDLLYKNPGKAIILCSRFSLMSSIITVFIIDKYSEIFSSAGSQVYEFLCSVIIIPLLITHIIELKRC